MDFFDLAETRATKITIRTMTNGRVLISMPSHIADQANLSGDASVRVQYGRNAASTGLRIKADPVGRWRLDGKGKAVRHLFVREIAPKTPVPRATELDFVIEENGLLLTLPAGWELQDDHILMPTRPGRRTPRQDRQTRQERRE